MHQRDVGRNLIYGLIDPKTRLIRYIGLSSTGHRRPKDHRSHSCPDTYCRRWVKTLQAQGLDYEITVLESVKRAADLGPAERWWIAYGRACGWPLTNIMAGGGPSEEAIIERQQRRAEYEAARARASAAYYRDSFSPAAVEARKRYLADNYGIPTALEQRCFQFYDGRRARLKFFEPQYEVDAEELISAVTAIVHVTRETAATLHEKWAIMRGIESPDLTVPADKKPAPELIAEEPRDAHNKQKIPAPSDVVHYFCLSKDSSPRFMCACGHEEPFNDQESLIKAINKLNAHVQRETASIQWKVSYP